MNIRARFFGGTWHGMIVNVVLAPFVIVPAGEGGGWRDQRYKLTRLDFGRAYVLEDRGEVCVPSD